MAYDPLSANEYRETVTLAERIVTGSATAVADRPALAAHVTPRPNAQPAPVATKRGFRFSGGLAALESHNFQLLFQGSLVTQIGMWMQQVAFGWLVLEMTDSPFYLGLAGFFRALPMLLIAPFGGVLADRLDRRRLLIASQLAIAGFSAVLAVMVGAGVARPWHLLLVSFLMGCAFSLNMPARQAMVAQLVTKDQLPSAVALNSMSMNSSRVVGPALAGGLIGIIGVAGCLMLHAVAYVWSVVNVIQIRAPTNERRARDASVLQNLAEGFRYCYEEKSVFGMLALATLTTVFGMQYMQLLPALARDVLGMGADGFGMLMTATGVGAVAGSVYVAGSNARHNRGTLLLLSAIGFGGFLCALSFTTNPLAVMALLAAAGGSNAVLMALNQTIIQETVPDHLRGRVMSAYMVTFGLTPLGALPAGAIAEQYGTPIAIFVGGFLCYVGALWVFMFRPQFRSI